MSESTTLSGSGLRNFQRISTGPILTATRSLVKSKASSKLRVSTASASSLTASTSATWRLPKAMEARTTPRPATRLLNLKETVHHLGGTKRYSKPQETGTVLLATARNGDRRSPKTSGTCGHTTTRLKGSKTGKMALTPSRMSKTIFQQAAGTSSLHRWTQFKHPESVSLQFQQLY